MCGAGLWTCGHGFDPSRCGCVTSELVASAFVFRQLVQGSSAQALASRLHAELLGARLPGYCLTGCSSSLLAYRSTISFSSPKCLVTHTPCTMCPSRPCGCLVATNLGHVPTRVDRIYTALEVSPVSTPSSFLPSLTPTVSRLCPDPWSSLYQYSANTSILYPVLSFTLQNHYLLLDDAFLSQRYFSRPCAGANPRNRASQRL